MLAAVLYRLRVTYEKIHDTRFISHLDMTNALNRAVRRARMPVAYTEGFSPRPRTAFGPPLPLFVEGEHELADIELAEQVDPAHLIASCNEVLPAGIRLLEGAYVPGKAPSITASILEATYRVEVKEGSWGVTQQLLDETLARTEIPIIKESKGTRKVVDIRPAILSLSMEGDYILHARVEASPTRTLNVFDLMGALEPGFTAAESARFRVVRVAFKLQELPQTAAAAAS